MKTILIGWIAALGLLTGSSGPANAQANDMKDSTTFRQIFPRGEKLPAQFSEYFIGQAYLAPLTHDDALGVPVSNVTFEPGCRNNWHSHSGGQLLIATAGRGYYQEEGRPARELRAGDVVEIAPDAVHWHGAAPESWFSHLAVECHPETNINTWLGPVDDTQYAAATTLDTSSAADMSSAPDGLGRWRAGVAASFARTDPELAELFSRFAFGEVPQYGDLDARTRMLVTLAAAIAVQASEAFGTLLRAALADGVDPAEIREVIYQAVPYAGFARTADFLRAADDIFTACGVQLPLAPRAGATPDDRLAKGLALQKSIFGEQIDRMYDSAPGNQKHIQRFLSANCFGDYQTRGGLDVRMRELLTYSMLVSLGGCEAQVKGHIRGNAHVGNGKEVLLAVTTQLLPWIGYPRTLNALACLNEVLPEEE